jgi:hypothetical protein
MVVKQYHRNQVRRINKNFDPIGYANVRRDDVNKIQDAKYWTIYTLSAKAKYRRWYLCDEERIWFYAIEKS